MVAPAAATTEFVVEVEYDERGRRRRRVVVAGKGPCNVVGGSCLLGRGGSGAAARVAELHWSLLVAAPRRARARRASSIASENGAIGKSKGEKAIPN